VRCPNLPGKDWAGWQQVPHLTNLGQCCCCDHHAESLVTVS
jgi:hypothetical protein